MLSDTKEPDHASQKASNYDHNFLLNQRLQFEDSLKDLKNLRTQLYSAAECFESSYNKNDHKQFVVQLSKDYVAKALISFVDHLGSVADKVNKLLDEKANELSATKIRFSCAEQRLSTFHEFIDLKGMSQQLLIIEATGHPKNYILPALETSSPFGKSKVLRSSVSSPPLLSKQQPVIKMPSREQSPNPRSFSFTMVVPNKEAGKRSISPFRFPHNRSGSNRKRSVSPSPSSVGVQGPSEPQRAISACRRQDMKNRGKEIESYTSRSTQLFRALVTSLENKCYTSK